MLLGSLYCGVCFMLLTLFLKNSTYTHIMKGINERIGMAVLLINFQRNIVIFLENQ